VPLWGIEDWLRYAPRRGLKALGPEAVQALRFVCSDMWKPYQEIIRAQAGQALHVLDRFHITMHRNQAVDQVRRAESGRLRAAGQAAQLKHTRWALLRAHEPLLLNWFRAKGEISTDAWKVSTTKFE